MLPPSEKTAYLSDPNLLSRVLRYHIIPGQLLTFSDLLGMSDDTRVRGESRERERERERAREGV